MCRNRRGCWCGLCFTTAALGLSLATADAALVKVIYSDIVGQPSAAPPSGVVGATAFVSFDRPYRSPDGTRWVFSALTNTGNTNVDEIIVVGSGRSGTLVLQEGTTVVEPGRTIDSASIDTKLGINDSGTVVFTGNLSGATTDDEAIIAASGGTFTVVIREGGAIAALPGINFGTSNSDPSINNAGQVACRSFGLIGAPASDTALVLDSGATLIARRNVTVPVGQAGGATDTWQNLDSTGFFVSENGQVLIQGDTNGVSTADDMVTINSIVVVQEGQVLPGSGFVSPVETDLEALMMTNGDWFVRGDNADQVDWVVRNGVVLAATDDPIIPGATETFDDTLFTATFFIMQSNNAGDYVIGGTTNASDPLFDAVLVLNGARVIARQGDAVDLNDDGIANDDAFIDIFNNDDSFLTEDGFYYFMADLRNGAGTSIGQAFLVIPACTGDASGDGVANEADLGLLLANWQTSVPANTLGDLNGDGFVSEPDLGVLLGNWQCGVTP